MKQLFTIAALLALVSGASFAQTVIFQENFESGTANAAWGTYYNGEETVVAKPMSAAPKALATGGAYVGLLQDINGSFTGSAVAMAGDLTLKDYSIEADVYCYQNQTLSAYSGLVVYADSAKHDFYKIRVDFDANDRINLSGLKSDPNTFLPLFSNDFKGVDYAGGYPKADGWHKLKMEVRTVSATKVSISCYFDNVMLKNSPVTYDNAAAVTAGRFGLYSFQQSATGLATYYDNIVVATLPAAAPTVIFQENFESGTANAAWGTYYNGEETVVAKPMSAAPKALATGGAYVGLLQDINGSFTGSAVAMAGELTLKDYAIEADVYCYQNQTLSAYSGLVVYADSAKHDFYKIRVDFDANDRINLSGLKSDPNTFLPLFSNDFKGVDYTGGYPKADGWHKLKMEIRTVSATKVSISCYFDNVMLKNSPITYDNAAAVTAGRFGLYSFQQSATGLATYYDNIVVTALAATAVRPESVRPNTFSLDQNYPNPFNPSTRISYTLGSAGSVLLTIHDMLGREVAVLVSSTEAAGQHSVNWNGKNAFGADVPSGVYLYSLRSGTGSSTMKMILMK